MNYLNIWNIGSWLAGITLVVLGILNVLLVHPVLGIVYLLLSFVFFPPVHSILKRKFGFRIPLAVRIILFIVIIWFTLGVGDLAEMYGL